MHADSIVSDTRSLGRILRLAARPLPVLSCVLIWSGTALTQGAAAHQRDVSSFPVATAAQAPSPPPSLSDKTYSPPNDGKTHEEYNLPQDQWGRAYREGLRQGYDAGRLFPEQLDQAYRQGLREGYQAWQYDDEDNARSQRLLRAHDQAVQSGLQAFQEGSYDHAADLFQLATELDHGDPACRLLAAQALFAVQQYEQALPLLRRAFELQPNLLYLRFDLHKDYGNPADLASQVADLQAVVAANPDWSGGYLLLGYELLHSGQRNQAYQAFSRAAQLDPVDTLCRKFLKISYPLPARPAPTAPAKPVAPAAKAQPNTSPAPGPVTKIAPTARKV